MDLSDLIQDFVEVCGTLSYAEWMLVLETLSELTHTPSGQGMIARIWLAVILLLCGRFPEDHIEEYYQFTPEQLQLLEELNEILANAE